MFTDGYLNFTLIVLQHVHIARACSVYICYYYCPLNFLERTKRHLGGLPLQQSVLNRIFSVAKQTTCDHEYK